MITNPLTQRPPMFDPADYLDVPDLSVLTWLTKPEWLQIAMLREELKRPKARPEYIQPDDPNMRPTVQPHFKTTIAAPIPSFEPRTMDQIAADAKEATAPVDRMYISQEPFRHEPRR